MDDSVRGASLEVVEKSKRRSWLAELFVRLVKEKPLGSIGGIITLVFLLVAIFADLLAPYGFNDTHSLDSLQGPSIQYIMGTDNLGRDVLSRVIYGARISVIIGLAATTLSVLVSIGIGILCGFLGGIFDIVVQRFVDAWMGFPSLVVLIILVSLTGPGLWQVTVVLGLQFGIGGTRVVRGAVMGIKENVYVDAAVAIGCPTWRLLARHILPNIMAPIIILFTTRVPAVIMTEASLSFLGFGIPPPQPSWGGMLSGSGRKYMFLAPWMAIWPGLALAFVVYGINMFGDAVRDLLDPRLRGGVGRYERVKTRKPGRKRQHQPDDLKSGRLLKE